MIVHLLTWKSVTDRLQTYFLKIDMCFRIPMVYVLVKKCGWNPHWKSQNLERTFPKHNTSAESSSERLNTWLLSSTSHHAPLELIFLVPLSSIIPMKRAWKAQKLFLTPFKAFGIMWYAKPRAPWVREKTLSRNHSALAGLFTLIHTTLSKCTQEVWTRWNCWRLGFYSWESTFGVVTNGLLWNWRAEVHPEFSIVHFWWYPGEGMESTYSCADTIRQGVISWT